MFDKNWVSPDLFFYDEKINIKHKYLNIDNIKTSWIFNPTFIDIIEHLNSINDLGIVTIFDLILSCSKIIKLNKISNIDIFIQNLITDFDSIDKISLQIQKID